MNTIIPQRSAEINLADNDLSNVACTAPYVTCLDLFASFFLKVLLLGHFFGIQKAQAGAT